MYWTKLALHESHSSVLDYHIYWPSHCLIDSIVMVFVNNRSLTKHSLVWICNGMIKNWLSEIIMHRTPFHFNTHLQFHYCSIICEMYPNWIRMIKILIFDAIIFTYQTSMIKKNTESHLDLPCIGHYSPWIGNYVK